MSQVAANADDYANGRLNIFFPGITPDLNGQCVSLVKWFLQDMTGVPDPQAARGDARYVGQTLVAQGYAVEVPYAERRRGDVICYEYGTFGHIGVVLSGDRTFEENVNWPGVASEVVDGAIVYASRIGSLSESWRHDQHIYRINSYTEGVPPVANATMQEQFYLTSPDGSRQDIFVRMSDNSLWQKYFGKNGWSDWTQIGEALVSLKEVEMIDPGKRYDIYGNGGAGDVMHFWFDGTGWHLESLGKPE